MFKKTIKGIILLFSLLLLTGCWDYVSLNDITIVSGIAIDKDTEKKQYKLSIEIISLAESAKSKAVESEVLEAVGKTIFDAIRNAKKRALSKLYFADMQTIIISNQIAKEDGVNSIISWFLKDAEVRETINLVISKEKTANEILTKKPIDYPVAAFQIKSILSADNIDTSSTKNIRLYKAYDIMHSNGMSLVLPVFHIVENNKKKVFEASGVAAFKKDKLVGYLSPGDSKYYLFADDSVAGGVLTLKLDDSKLDNIALEIAHNATSKSFTYKDNKFKFNIKTNTKVYINEYRDQAKEIDEKKVKEITAQAEKMIESNIKKVINKAKKEFKTDIFCFGNLVYKNNPSLWKKVSKNWDSFFINSDINVDSKISIINTAATK
jgi:spore germination protein KC